jgi:hypothetical protein
MMPYPCSVSVESTVANRNRLTTAFRLILAVPHLILVGGAGISVAYRDKTSVTAGSEGAVFSEPSPSRWRS